MLPHIIPNNAANVPTNHPWLTIGSLVSTFSEFIAAIFGIINANGLPGSLASPSRAVEMLLNHAASSAMEKASYPLPAVYPADEGARSPPPGTRTRTLHRALLL